MWDSAVDGIILGVVVILLFVLRIVAATVVFYYLLPSDGHCPHCDAMTLRIQAKGWARLFPKFRPSWCMACGWEGLLRPGDIAPTAVNAQEHWKSGGVNAVN